MGLIMNCSTCSEELRRPRAIYGRGSRLHGLTNEEIYHWSKNPEKIAARIRSAFHLHFAAELG